MIYAIVGTDTNKREKAYEIISSLGDVSAHIYSEQTATLEPLISASNLFGDSVIVNLIQVMDLASSRDEVVRLLPDMKESLNIFIIDEPFADANRVAKLTKYAEKVYDAREEKKKDVDVFTLCNLFARRDKKEVWVEWMRIRDLDSPEAIHGALWWKFQTIWADVRAGKPSKFTLSECEEIGGKLLRAPILAHRGEADLKVELEKIMLSI
ncbi:hypothetical protein K9M47_04885 [Candidatus Gracilibacteria bacterium]|nr:hypothetical protein [Candidatus Gracilibacteria bacterium]MCF7898908.1 hypothetical protein [Candidatus Paceibacterota bacterium]